jgi:hypothetical protein
MSAKLFKCHGISVAATSERGPLIYHDLATDPAARLFVVRSVSGTHQHLLARMFDGTGPCVTD